MINEAQILKYFTLLKQEGSDIFQNKIKELNQKSDQMLQDIRNGNSEKILKQLNDKKGN